MYVHVHGMYIVEPLSNGQFWASHFVHCREADFFSEVENVSVPFRRYGKYSFIVDPFIGGSTVCQTIIVHTLIFL